MKRFDWNNPRWRRRFWIVATIVLVFVLASHPELRLLVPMLDAMGLDIFIAVLGMQVSAHLSSTLKPLWLRAWRGLVPAIRATDRLSYTVELLRYARDFARYAVFNWLDHAGPRVWLRLHTLVRVARLGPDDAFRRARAAQFA